MSKKWNNFSTFPKYFRINKESNWADSNSDWNCSNQQESISDLMPQNEQAQMKTWDSKKKI
jgi:hypothetical protein